MQPPARANMSWDIRRGAKTYRVTDPKTLLKLRAEQKFNDGDQVRTTGQSQWVPWQEFDWDGVQRWLHDGSSAAALFSAASVDQQTPHGTLRVSESPLPPPSATENETVEQADSSTIVLMTPLVRMPDSAFAETVDARAAGTTTPASGANAAMANPAPVTTETSSDTDETGWWHDSSPSLKNQRSNRRMLKFALAFSGACGLAMIVILGFILFPRHDQPQSNSNKSNTNQSDARTDQLAAHTAEAPQADLDLSSNADNTLSAANSSVDSDSKSSNQLSSVASEGAITAEMRVTSEGQLGAMPIEQVEAGQVVGGDLIAQSATSKPSAEQPSGAGEADGAKPQVSKPTPATPSPNVLASPVEKTAAAATPNPTPDVSDPGPAAAPTASANRGATLTRREEQLYQQIVATVEHHRNTYRNLREERKGIQQSQVAIAKLMTQIEFGNNQVANLQSTYREAQQVVLALYAFTGLSLEQRAQLVTAQQTIANIERQTAQMQTSLLSLNRNLQIEQSNLQNFTKQRLEVIGKEELAVASLMDAIDLFEEMPLAIHTLLIDDAQKWSAEEQDLFIAYLVQSAAAVRLKKLDVPELNQQKMVAQAAAIPADELKLRSRALSRVSAASSAICALAKARENDYAESFKHLQKTLTGNGACVEFWMLRGRLGMEKAGVNEANSYFKRAISEKPADPRVYRYFLQSLLTQKEVPADYLRMLLQNLASKSSSSQSANWLVAAETCIHLRDLENAEKYLAKVDDELLADRVTAVKQSLAQAKVAPVQ